MDAPATDEVVSALVEEGFEAVAACIAGDVAAVTYENRLFRYDVRALDDVTRLARPHLDGISRLRLIPTRNGVPLAEVTAPVAPGPSPDLTELKASTEPSPLPLPAANSPRFKLDLVLHPHLRLGFGDFETPVRVDLGVAPAATVSLWPGGSATAQIIVPFVEQTDTQGEEADGLRPGIVAAHQEIRLPFSTFARVSAGLFTRERYGLDVTTRTFIASGRASLTLRVGQTGFAALDGSTWLYSSPSVTTYSARLDGVVLPQYGLGAGVTVARYLSEEPGFRVDVYRSFGETNVGVFALTSEGDPNVGGRITIPLPVRRHAKPGRVRARLANAFALEYRYRRVPGEAPDYDASVQPWEPLGPLLPALLPYHIRRYSGP